MWATRAFDAVVELDFHCVFENDELAEVLDFHFWRWYPDVHTLELLQDIAFEMIFVFVECSFKPRAIVAGVKSSSMVIV